MVILGPVDTKRRTAQRIAPRVVIDGEQAAQTNDPAKLAGDLVEVVSLTAELLELCRERLRAGEVVIRAPWCRRYRSLQGSASRSTSRPLGTLTVQLT